MVNIWFLSLAFNLLLVFPIFCSSELRVQYSTAKIPPESCHRLHYDGDDSIYISGGCEILMANQLLKYSIRSDRISRVATLPNLFEHGSIQSDKTGENLYLFGVGDSGNFVLKYDLAKNSSFLLSAIPWGFNRFPSFKLDSGISQTALENTVLILGVEDDFNPIFKFDLELEAFNFTSKCLPIDLSAAAAISVGGRIFVFPSKNGNGGVWELNVESLELLPIEENKNNLRELQAISNLGNFPSVTSNGRDVYIIAGFAPDLNSREGILKFEPNSNSTDFLPVGNWPVGDEERYFMHPPRCEFVAKLERIYCFGGWSVNLDGSGAEAHDEIFYIDMNGETVTTSAGLETTMAEARTTPENNAAIGLLTSPLPFVTFGIMTLVFRIGYFLS